MKKFSPERRRFLGFLASLPLVFTLGCDRSGKRVAVTPATLGPEESLNKLLLTLGPWHSEEREKAEDFAKRFLKAEGAGSAYLSSSGKLVQNLASRFPDDSFALKEIDLTGLSGEERELLLNLVTQLYNYIEVRFFVSNEPPWGECQPDRTRYTLPPAK